MKLVLKHIKLPKYYGQSCLEYFRSHFTSLVMVQIGENSPLLAKIRKYIKKPLAKQS